MIYDLRFMIATIRAACRGDTAEGTIINRKS
jgi:hypothetical protein